MQKRITIANLYIRIFLSAPPVKRFLSRSLYLGNLLSLSVYVWVRLMFHDFPIVLTDEAALILRLMFTGTCLAGFCIGGFNLMMYAADYYTAASTKRKLARSSIARSNHHDKTFSPGYNLFNENDAVAIDNAGSMRYVIKAIKPATGAKKQKSNILQGGGRVRETETIQ
ncbi:MAG: hypothetical protein ABJB86_12855 [Bacteroidota bacterium]